MKWLPVTEERYYEMLGVLPPASQGPSGAFQVGEAMDHKNGRPTFASFKMEGGEYFESEEALTYREFVAEVGQPAAYYYAGCTMTLADAIKNAVDTRDPREVESVANFMRFRLGLDYNKSFAMVRKVFPQMTVAEWDELLYQADQLQ